MKSVLEAVDDLDTRREVTYLFQQLPPIERLVFLYHCCDLIGSTGRTISGENIYVTITNPTGDPTECYLDFWGMVSQYGLPVQKALAELERRVKQFTSPRGILLP